jgi:hypothetical protein
MKSLVGVHDSIILAIVSIDGGGCEQNEHVTSLHHNPTCVAEF